MPLLRHEIRERRGDDLAVAKLRHAVRRKRHRRARVERDHHRQVRRLAKLSRVQPIAAREQLPVEILEIVAGAIRTMLAELRAVAVERTAMSAGAQSFDDEPRGELEIRRSPRRRSETARTYDIGRMRAGAFAATVSRRRAACRSRRPA